MKPMSLKRVTKILKGEGFVQERNNGHLVFVKNGLHIALSRSPEVSPGVMRQVYQTIEKARK